MAPFHEIFSQLLQSENRDAFYKDKGMEAKWEMAGTKVDLNLHISQLISDWIILVQSAHSVPNHSD